MDEQEKTQEELHWEDILAEFREEPGAELPPDALPPEEDVLIWDGDLSKANQAVPADPHDTVRLDQITRAVREQTPELENTVAFSLPDTEPEPEPEFPVIPVPEEPAVEPYSESWEPEYEEPVGEYVPPEPIVFRPKSRLRELKRKLVAGPERRYYELSELGLGRLQFAMLACFLVVLLSGGTTALHAMGLLGEERIKLVIFCQFFSLLLSALLGSYQLMEGVGDLFLRRRFSLNTLLVCSLFACVADGILCLQQLRVPCCAAFSLHTLMSLWGAYHRRNTEMGQMDTMRKATRLDSVVSEPDYYEALPGFLRGEGQVEDFMDQYRKVSGPQKVLDIYALAVFALSVALGVLAGMRNSMSVGLQAASAAMLVAVPATTYVTLSRPMNILERRLHQLGAVLCGWRGVVGLSKPGCFPVDDQDLFPSGTAKMNGVKFYGTRRPDDVVAYAAALIGACGGAMAPLFTQLLESRNGYHYDAVGLRSYPGGVGAEVDGEAVLAGTVQFMKDMGVEIPEGNRVSQAVYVAVDGMLSGVFAVSYQKLKLSAAGLHTLCAYRRLKPVLVTPDFMLSEGFLRAKFGISTRRIRFPEDAVRRELALRRPEEGSPALALTTREELAGAAYAVTGARALRSASIVGTVVHILGGVLGLAMLLVLGFLGAGHLLTPMNVLLYELLWMIPGLLITEWTRAV